MKWMIASDIHGSAYYCRQLLNAYNREQADRLLLLGDLLYHGPRNDLPEEYDPKQVIELFNAKNNIFSVSGATAMPKSTRWYSNFPLWQITAPLQTVIR